MAADHTRNVQRTWLYTLGSIVFFVGFYAVFAALFLLELVAADPGALVAALIVLQLAGGVLQVRYCWFLRAGRGSGIPSVGWTVAMLAPAVASWILGLVVVGAGFVAAAPLWTATCLIACLVPHRWRWPLLGAGAVVFVGHAALAAAVNGETFAFLRDGGAWAVGIYAALLPGMLLTSLWFWEVVVELDRHRRAAADLAVAQERLRFASDLHDTQGHHLQVISLKSQLAERLLAADPQAARENIHEVGLIAKQALEETRSLVAGYRQVSLDLELQNAQEVLTATGARCSLRIGALPDDPAVRAALASAVREATTNILRHSVAGEVAIAVGREREAWVLEIANDGVEPDAAASLSDGNGLLGMRERLTAVGGVLEAGMRGGRFVVRATVPAAVTVAARSAG